MRIAQTPPQSPKITTTALEKGMADGQCAPAQSSPSKRLDDLMMAMISGIDITDLEHKMGDLQCSPPPPPQNTPHKTVESVIAEMVLETPLAEAKDMMSMLQFGFPSRVSKKDGEGPGWYSSWAMYYAADPWRRARARFTKKLIEDNKEWISDDWKDGIMKVLDYGCGTGIASQALAPHVSHIIGVDSDETFVPVYNEIAKRLGSTTCTMQAYIGNIVTDENYEVENFPASEAFGGFDLVVLSLAIDCFEILDLCPHARHEQVIFTLHALVEPLSVGGTLLIIDIERVTERTDQLAMIDGKKTTGYHSSDIVKALEDMDMEGVEVLGDKRFQWEATEEERKTCFPTEYDSVFFMLKAKKKAGTTHE